jgi:hypothetical protein
VRLLRLFSLLDPFAFQHAEAPARSVSMPLRERLFGQCAQARFDNVGVAIEDKTKRQAQAGDGERAPHGMS